MIVILISQMLSQLMQAQNHTTATKINLIILKLQRTNKKTNTKLRQNNSNRSSRDPKERIKSQNLKEVNKQLQKSSEESICLYQQYTKDIQNQRNQNLQTIRNLQKENQEYREYLKYSILELVEIFYFVIKPQKSGQEQRILNQKKFGKLYQKLEPIIEELQIKVQLENRCCYQNKENQAEEYLIMSGAQFSLQNSVEDIGATLLDTFNCRNSEQARDPIIRKLFDGNCQDQNKNSELYSHELQNQSSILVEQQNYPIFRQSSQKEQQRQVKNNNKYKSGQKVTIIKDYYSQSSDYLNLKKNDKVTLLRKVGNLWIAEIGDKIGYVQSIIMSQ